MRLSRLSPNGGRLEDRDIFLLQVVILTRWFLSMLKKCRAWGGNLLANIGPAPDGTMPEDFYPLCDAPAEWMAKNRGSLNGVEGSQP